MICLPPKTTKTTLNAKNRDLGQLLMDPFPGAQAGAGVFATVLGCIDRMLWFSGIHSEFGIRLLHIY